jgi:hypothetical protein
VITSDCYGHDGLRGIFGYFSGFIFMQKNGPESTGITRIIFLRKTAANHGYELTSAMQPPTSWISTREVWVLSFTHANAK